jgi:aspartate/methionine/tyrosine aminotransferase
MIDALAPHGLVHAGGPMTFYLWLRDEAGADGWKIAARLAQQAGMLVSPGDLYGHAGAMYARLALVQPEERLALAQERLGA